MWMQPLFGDLHLYMLLIKFLIKYDVEDYGCEAEILPRPFQHFCDTLNGHKQRLLDYRIFLKKRTHNNKYSGCTLCDKQLLNWLKFKFNVGVAYTS